MPTATLSWKSANSISSRFNGFSGAKRAAAAWQSGGGAWDWAAHGYSNVHREAARRIPEIVGRGCTSLEEACSAAEEAWSRILLEAAAPTAERGSFGEEPVLSSEGTPDESGGPVISPDLGGAIECLLRLRASLSTAGRDPLGDVIDAIGQVVASVLNREYNPLDTPPGAQQAAPTTPSPPSEPYGYIYVWTEQGLSETRFVRGSRGVPNSKNPAISDIVAVYDVPASVPMPGAVSGAPTPPLPDAAPDRLLSSIADDLGSTAAKVRSGASGDRVAAWIDMSARDLRSYVISSESSTARLAEVEQVLADWEKSRGLPPAGRVVDQVRRLVQELSAQIKRVED